MEIHDNVKKLLLELIETQENRKFAKTYAKKSPHEYIVEGNLDDTDKQLFTLLARLIKKYGEEVLYFNSKFTCLRIGDHKYRHMEDIINRDVHTGRYGKGPHHLLTDRYDTIFGK